MKRLNLIYRKRFDLFFSIEKVFDQLAPAIGKQLQVQKIYAPLYSYSIGSIIKNISALRKNKADIYHITGDIHYAVMAFPKKKTILTIHDCVFLYKYKGFKQWVITQLYLKRPVSGSRYVTTISEKTKQEIIKFTGCDPNKIVVIQNPVSETIYFQPKEFNTQNPVLLFIGSTPNKNLPRVAEALRGLNCTLRIIGEVPKEIQPVLAGYGINYSARSGISEAELAAEYAGSDIILFPSLYEGFGLPVIEGQQAGRPVITSNISPMKDVAGEGACLVNPEEVASIRKGLDEVISNKTYREQLQAKGFQNVSRFSTAAIAAQYQKLYSEFI